MNQQNRRGHGMRKRESKFFQMNRMKRVHRILMAATVWIAGLSAFESTFAQGGCGACAGGSTQVAITGWANLEASGQDPVDLTVSIGGRNVRFHGDDFPALTQMSPQVMLIMLNPGQEITISPVSITGGTVASSNVHFECSTCAELEVSMSDPNISGWVPGINGWVTGDPGSWMKIRLPVAQDFGGGDPGNGQPGQLRTQMSSGELNDASASQAIIDSPVLNATIELAPLPVDSDIPNEMPSGFVALAQPIAEILNTGTTLKSKLDYLYDADDVETLLDPANSNITIIRQKGTTGKLAEVERIASQKVEVRVHHTQFGATPRKHTLEVTGGDLIIDDSLTSQQRKFTGTVTGVGNATSAIWEEETLVGTASKYLVSGSDAIDSGNRVETIDTDGVAIENKYKGFTSRRW